MIVGHFSAYLNCLIFVEQGVFIEGRSIFENITLTQEIIQFINKKSKGGNVIIIVDMVKVYDRVDLNFLTLV